LVKRIGQNFDKRITDAKTQKEEDEGICLIERKSNIKTK
jgi:hypothetical protein